MSLNLITFEQSVTVPLNVLIVFPADASILVKLDNTLQVAPELRVSIAFVPPTPLEDVIVCIRPILVPLTVRADVAVYVIPA